MDRIKCIILKKIVSELKKDEFIYKHEPHTYMGNTFIHERWILSQSKSKELFDSHFITIRKDTNPAQKIEWYTDNHPVLLFEMLNRTFPPKKIKD